MGIVRILCLFLDFIDNKYFFFVISLYLDEMEFEIFEFG